jgi:hypothetical protein
VRFRTSWLDSRTARSVRFPKVEIRSWNPGGFVKRKAILFSLVAVAALINLQYFGIVTGIPQIDDSVSSIIAFFGLS